MITKAYRYDICKWEVMILAETSSDDISLGFFDTVMEANKRMEKHLENNC
jgi:hypothetical protein